MDEDKSDSNSADEYKRGAWRFSVKMTHPNSFIIQSCFKQMGKKNSCEF